MVRPTKADKMKGSLIIKSGNIDLFRIIFTKTTVKKCSENIYNSIVVFKTKLVPARVPYNIINS